MYEVKLPEAYLISFHLFWHKKAHVAGPWTWAMSIKTFWYSSLYSSPAMKVGRQTSDRSHHINLRRRIWAMELIAAVGTKLNSQEQGLIFFGKNPTQYNKIKFLIVLQCKVSVTATGLKLLISRLFRARSFLTFRQLWSVDHLKRVRDVIRTYSQSKCVCRTLSRVIWKVPFGLFAGRVVGTPIPGFDHLHSMLLV